MSDAESAPIMCTLGAGDFRERIAWIAALNRDALVAQVRSDLAIRLDYRAAAVERVRQMMRQEQSCCAFLSFALDEGPDLVSLTVTAPEEARIAADALFEQFASSGVTQRTGCGCC